MRTRRSGSAVLSSILLIVTVVLAGCATPTVDVTSPSAQVREADYEYFDTKRALVGRCDLIVVGDVISGRDESLNVNMGPDRDSDPQALDYRISTVRVMTVIKGEAEPGNTIEVKQLLADGNALLQAGRKAILFLEAYPDNIPYSLVNPGQGQIGLERGASDVRPDNRLFADGQKQDDIVEELKQLTKKK
ncbi:MAG: hypothetical protein ABFC80_06385 [Coriobacteriales bacterium]